VDLPSSSSSSLVSSQLLGRRTSSVDSACCSLILFAAGRTQNIIAIRQKATSEQQRATFVTDEAIGVPLTPLERYELGTVHA